MEAASIDTIKEELKQLPPRQVLDLLLRLARFRKENKELLTYLLFESADQQGFIATLKTDIDTRFAELRELPTGAFKKQFRKMQRQLARPLKYMGSKPATAELYVHILRRIRELDVNFFTGIFLQKMTQQYLTKVEKLLPALAPDLAHDLKRQIDMP